MVSYAEAYQDAWGIISPYLWVAIIVEIVFWFVAAWLAYKYAIKVPFFAKRFRRNK